MQVLVTGGCGFVGKNLVKRLLRDGHEVTVTATGRHPVPEGAKVTYCGLQGVDWDMVEEQDIIFHQAAITDTLYENDWEMMRINHDDTLQLHDVAWWGNCKKLIVASSTAVYGDAPAPYEENVTSENPLNTYAHSKKKVDDFLRTKMHPNSGMPVVILRYCNVYGPGEDHKGRSMSMVGQMLRKAIDGKSPDLFTPGDQQRDWVYIDDVVEANIKAMEYGADETIDPARLEQMIHGYSGIFNIGTGVATTFNKVWETILDVTKKDLKPNYIDCPFPDKYQDHTCCKIERAQHELRWAPKYNLANGIKAYYEALV